MVRDRGERTGSYRARPVRPAVRPASVANEGEDPRTAVCAVIRRHERRRAARRHLKPELPRDRVRRRARLESAESSSGALRRRCRGGRKVPGARERVARAGGARRYAAARCDGVSALGLGASLSGPPLRSDDEPSCWRCHRRLARIPTDAPLEGVPHRVQRRLHVL